MANHVNNYITVMGTEEVEKVFNSLGENFTIQKERDDWEAGADRSTRKWFDRISRRQCQHFLIEND